mmetsp:Transcript_7743/g.30583  ORF Transcript_7743/g.30583 Transcript_7743/m.30583 type:complete len:220 (-) Transcript_7743:212-871(-)
MAVSKSAVTCLELESASENRRTVSRRSPPAPRTVTSFSKMRSATVCCTPNTVDVTAALPLKCHVTESSSRSAREKLPKATLSVTVTTESTVNLFSTPASAAWGGSVVVANATPPNDMVSGRAAMSPPKGSSLASTTAAAMSNRLPRGLVMLICSNASVAPRISACPTAGATANRMIAPRLKTPTTVPRIDPVKQCDREHLPQQNGSWHAPQPAAFGRRW